MKQLKKIALNIEPIAHGNHDAEKRALMRKEIKKQIPDFDENWAKNFVSQNSEIEVEIECYLPNPDVKDVDNLAKIPIDAIFFSGANEPGYKTWENKIMFLSIRKRKDSQNKVEITLRGNQTRLSVRVAKSTSNTLG